MTDRARRLLRDLIAYGIGEVVTKAIAFLALPVYTRVFGPSVFGEYAFVGTVAALASGVLILGGDSAYARYFFTVKTPQERRVLTTTWVAFLGASSLVVSIGLVAFVQPIAGFAPDPRGIAEPLAFAFLTVPVAIMNRLLGQALRNSFRPWSYTAINVAGAALSVIVPVVAVVYTHAGLTGLFAGALVAEAIQLPVRAWMARDMLGRSISTKVLSRLLAYGIPLVPTSIAYWVFLLSDRVVLGSLAGAEQVGLYAAAAAIVAAAGTAITAVGQAWSPHVVAAFEEDEDQARSLVRDATPFLIGGFGLLSVLLATFAPEGVDLLAGTQFVAGAGLVLPLSLGLLAQATTTVTALGMSLRFRTGHLAALAWAAAVVNVVLNLFLDGSFGAWGAAWATAISYSSLSVVYAVASNRLWPVGFDRLRTFSTLLVVVAFTIGSSLLPQGGPMALGVRVVYVCACAGVLVALLGVKWPGRHVRTADVDPFSPQGPGVSSQ